MPRGTFLSCCCQCPCPCGQLFLTHASTGGTPTLAGSFGSVSCGVTAPLLWVLVCIRFCLRPLKLESLCFPQSYGSLIIKYCWASRSDYLGIALCQSLCQIPRLGSLSWGSEPSQQWENFFGGIVLQVVGHPTSGYWVWFCRELAPPTIFLFGHGVSFLGAFQCPPVNDCSTASCNFGTLTGGDECKSKVWSFSFIIRKEEETFISIHFTS